MKMNVLVAAALMFGGMIAPSFAYDGAAGLRSPVDQGDLRHPQRRRAGGLRDEV